MADDKGSLPPGWDMKFDSRTGKFYYINHYTKTTTWEDPRDRYQQIGKAGVKEKENTKPEAELGLQVANHQVASMRRELESEQDFRNPRANSPVSGRANTPQMGYAHASLGRLQLDTENFDSPLPSQRSTLRRDSHILAEISELETNLANQETALAKISAMFPTVEESHIRDLYKKYHGSQAVVMSALQVAKHPIVAPGPSSIYSPLTSRHATLPGAAQVPVVATNTIQFQLRKRKNLGVVKVK